MPMTDYVDERCPFCRNYLTDLDGVYECQDNGCGAYETLPQGEHGEIIEGEPIWNAPELPFFLNYRTACEYEVYNSDGQLVGGYRLKDMGIF